MTGEELLKELPADPRGLDEWIASQAEHGYIIKERDKGVCTRCKKTVSLHGYKHNDECYCPKCNEKAVIKEKRYGRKGLTECGRVLWFTKKGVNIYAKLVLYEISFEASIPTVKKEVTDIYKFSEKEILRFNYACKWGDSWKYGWYQMKNITIPGLPQGGSFAYGLRNKYDRELIYTPNFDIFKKSCLKYADVQEFYEKHGLGFKALLNYVRDSVKYQSLELLRKAGFEDFVIDKIYEKHGAKEIHWRGTELRKILRADDMNEVRKFRGMDFNLLSDYKMLKRYGYVCASLEETKTVSNMMGYNPKQKLEKLSQIYDMSSIIKYLKKQKKNIQGLGLTGTYLDYIGECRELELDITKKEVLFPSNLQQAHERTSARIEIIANKKEDKKIAAKAEKLKAIEWQDAGLIVRAARSVEEIVIEGERQSHCVGTYIRKVADGNSNIFFIRKADESDKAYYTVELILDSTGYHLAQCRGYKNCNMTKEVKAFIDKWMEKVVKKVGEKKRRKAA